MFLLALSAALAGDPCPIQFRVTDLGPLPWASAPAATDPVWDALVAHVGKADCVEARTVRAREGKVSLGGQSFLWSEGVQTRLVDANKAYRCSNAHEHLAALTAVVRDGHWVDGDVFYQRGSRRVMLTTLGWGTVCVPLSELEDPKTGAAAVAKMWEASTAKLVQYRHDNP